MPRLLRSLLSVSGVNAINGILGLVLVPVALRTVGAEGYGLFAIYGVIASYVALSDLGVSKNLLRTLAASRSGEDRIRILQTALSVYLGLAVLLITVLPAIFWLVPKHLFAIEPAKATAAGWIASMAVVEYVLGIPVSMMQSACIGEERFDRFARFNLASGITRYALLLTAFLVFRSPVAAAVSQAARRLVDLALAAGLMGTLPGAAWRPRWSGAEIRSMISDSSTLSAAQILYLSTVQGPSLLVNWSFGLHALGIYRAVYDLSAKVFFFGNVLGLVIFPRFAKTRAGDAFSRALPAMLRASWSFYAAIACAAALLSPFLLPLLGLRDPAALAVFPLICLGLCLNSHGILSTEAMQAGRLWPEMIGISVLSLAVLAGVFYTCLPDLGLRAIGAAWIGAQTTFVLLADHLIVKTRTLQNHEWSGILVKTFLLSLCCIAVWPDLLTPSLRLLVFTILLAAFLTSAMPLLKQTRIAAGGRS